MVISIITWKQVVYINHELWSLAENFTSAIFLIRDVQHIRVRLLLIT